MRPNIVVLPPGLVPRDVISKIEIEAVEEINAELRAEAVAEAKARLLDIMRRRRWWHAFVPFTVKIERRS